MAARFDVYGKYFYDQYSCKTVSSVSATITMGAAPPINSTFQQSYATPPLANISCTTRSGCDGRWTFDSVGFFLDGWPGYLYGNGLNTFYFENIGEGTTKEDVAFIYVSFLLSLIQ